MQRIFCVVRSSEFRFLQSGVALMIIITGILKISLPAFKALRDFEWIGNLEMPTEIIEALLNTHKPLHGLNFR